MTKKIKFLKDCFFNNKILYRNDKSYSIIGEDNTHYSVIDEFGNTNELNKFGCIFEYEIIEEPKVTKYIKIITFTGTSQSWYKDLTLNRYYKVTHEDNSRYYFNDNIGSKVFITKDSPNYIISEGHPYKHLIKKAAELAEETMDVGSHFQWKSIDGVWKDWTINEVPIFNVNAEYRLKPRTIKIGNREINAPERNAPNEGQTYYIRHCCKFRAAAALFVGEGLTFQRLDSPDASHPGDGRSKMT